MQNWVKKGQVGSRDLILKFWDPLHILGTVRGRNVKFGMTIHSLGIDERIVQLGQREPERGHVTYF